jgi:signal transduction histidine kinase
MLLAALLVATLALAALFAYEAHQAVRAHRATAERVVRDYAALSAWELVASTAVRAESILAAAVRPASETKAVSPYEELPSAALLASAAARLPACPEPGAPPRTLFRLRLRDGAIALAPVEGAARSSGTRALGEWVADTVAAHARATYQAGARYALLVGAGRWSDVSVVYGVRDAQFGAPLAAYGIVTCTAALGAPLFAAAAAPVPVRGGDAPLPDDSLVALAVHAPDGRELWRSAPEDPDASAAEARVGPLTLRGALRPGALARLAPPPAPASRLPLLAGLLALTALLAVAALLLLRREQELARLRADFTSSVSHELRTPLAQILLFGETLSMDRVRSDAERRMAADTIVQETRRLIHMVENVLHFARAERGLETPALRPLPLAPLVRDAVRAFAPLAESAGSSLELAAMDDEATALVDPAAVRQVLLNLLDNAVKYGTPGQAVCVAVGRAGPRVLVQVDDQGPGVPRGDRERVWAAFERLTRGDARGGSGIGLAVVRELVALHHGEAWVEDAPGGGARFVVALPAVGAGGPSDGGDAPGGPPRLHDGDGAGAERHRSIAGRSGSARTGSGVS